jgi:hypothetical protein
MNLSPIGYIILGVGFIFLVYEWITRIDRLIRLALRIYFRERSEGSSTLEAREKVLKALVLTTKREDVLAEKELIPEKGAPFLNFDLLDIEPESKRSSDEMDIKLLVLAICIQKSHTRIGARRFVSYQEKINNIYKKVKENYPQIK